MRLAARDGVETRDGTVRVMPALTTQLTATAPQWGKAVAPVVERVARELAGRKLATPLTEANRSAGRERVRQTRLDDAPISVETAATATSRQVDTRVRSPHAWTWPHDG